MRTTFVSPRGRCTGCGEMRAVRKDGRVGRHTSLGVYQDTCEGAGLPPMEDTTTPVPTLPGPLVGYRVRIECPVCDSATGLRTDGMVGSHTWYKPQVGWVRGCSGVGKPPRYKSTNQPIVPASPPVTVTEHATGMSGGGMNVRPDDPEIERVYPLAVWIAHRQRDGGRVYRRRIVVVDDWEEVPRVDE